MELPESSQGTSWEQPRRVQILETQLLFSHHVFSLPHPLCCSVWDPLSCLLTFPLPRAAISLIPRSSPRCEVMGGQFWVQTAAMQGQEHGCCSSPAQWCGRRRRRMAACGQGKGHSRSQSGWRQNLSGSSRNWRRATWGFKSFFQAGCWMCNCNIFIWFVILCVLIRKKKCNFLLSLGQNPKAFFFFTAPTFLHQYYKAVSEQASPSSPAFPLRKALGVHKPRHPVPSTLARTEDTEAVLMQ